MVLRKDKRIRSINGDSVATPLEVEFVSLLGDRKNNQDRAEAFLGDHRALLVLADGMGGHSDGALAAQCVIDQARELFPQMQDLPPVPMMQRIALQAHQQIGHLNPELSDREQPRTTVVMLVVEEGRAVFTHSGDSRGYLIRNGQVLYRTRDHSVVEGMMRRGELTEEQARKHPFRNQVSRCLGGLTRPTPLEVTPCPPLAAGDTFLLCSDGLWEPLSDAELCGSDSLQALAERATERNLGRADNTTALRTRLQSV